MKRSNILAHRGWWNEAKDKNSLQALRRALEAGFGIETDFRDLNGAVVVSHDPPRGETLDAKSLFMLYRELQSEGRLALNIKADGLQKALLKTLSECGVMMTNAFAFDMAVPDALGYLADNFPAYTRISEYEREPSFLDRATGVWVDNFTGEFPQVTIAQELLDAGHRVCIVSSELHHRDQHALWDEVVKAKLHESLRFELCTDFPQNAHALMGTD